MAPSETANPRKRSKPPFNPPRPKTTGSGISKSKSSTSTRKANIGSIFNEGPRTSKATAKSTTKARNQRPAVREQEPEDDEDEDEDNAAADSLLDDEADSEEDNDDDEPTEQEADDASDADMMLAEVTHDLPEDSSARAIYPNSTTTPAYASLVQEPRGDEAEYRRKGVCGQDTLRRSYGKGLRGVRLRWARRQQKGGVIVRWVMMMGGLRWRIWRGWVGSWCWISDGVVWLGRQASGVLE